MFKFFQKIYVNCLDILFPEKCVVCGVYGSLCCYNCVDKIEKIATPTCPECGKISKMSQYCPSCKSRIKPYLYSVSIACNYHSDVIKVIIHDLKYSGITALSQICGELIYQRIKDISSKRELVIVPVPLYKYRQNIRGFNQSEMIARYLSKRLNQTGGSALIKKVNTAAQARLSRQKRLSNLEGAFECVDKALVFGKDVLLVDDVMTTGATLNECAKTLKMAGAKKVYGAVIARNV